MKFTSAIVAVAVVVGVSATAIPEACFADGQPCSMIKRAAEALALPDEHPEKRDAEAYANAWCNNAGTVCTKTRRAAEAFAEALAEPDLVLDARCESDECYKARSLTRDLANIVALSARDASPEAYLESLGLRDEEKLRRDAEEHEKRSPWCNNAGTVCTKQKREAWCNNAGTVCTKKRDAGCGDVGGPCYKLKRAAEAVASAISAPSPWCNNAGTVCTREAWCNNAGTVCTKEKREAEALAKAWCNNAGTVCTKSKRDAHAMANAVNDILAQI